MHLYHAKTARMAAMPADKHDRHDLRQRGYSLAEELVDTVNGHHVQISCEPSVNSGRGAEQALQLIRNDPGNEGKNAFMTPQNWESLGADERRRMCVGSGPAGFPPTPLDPAEARLAESRARDAYLVRIADLERQLTEARQPGAVS